MSVESVGSRDQIFRTLNNIFLTFEYGFSVLLATSSHFPVILNFVFGDNFSQTLILPNTILISALSLVTATDNDHHEDRIYLLYLQVPTQGQAYRR